VVQSPWHPVIDVPSLHCEVKDRIREVLGTCGQAVASRCLTVVAPAGYGKTHLLAWTRQLVDERNDTVFVYVSPYTPGSVTLEQHVMRATVDALWSRSLRQKAGFEQAARSFLVGCYDRVIDTGSARDIKETLRTGTVWSRLFRRSRLKSGPLGTQDQLATLQRAFGRRSFFEVAFAEFSQRNPVGADGVRPDWDAFVAACLLTCGDARQRWHAERWFRADRIPPDVLEPFHLDNPCQGTEKVRNGLFTLQKLVGQSFCVAFDQLEDTYLALAQPGNEAIQFSQQLGILLRNLSVMPGFCLLFSFQLSAWQLFPTVVPPMLVDRMVEGYGAQTLSVLDDATAWELVQERMRVTVWSKLAEGSPATQPYFPFTAAEVRQMRIDTGGELRAFLPRAQEEFDKRLSSPRKPPPRPPIRLASIEPREVMSHEATAVLIRGENLPAEVWVLFGGHPVETPPVCRPAAGEIDVTTPVGLIGDVDLRVEAADDPGNGDCVVLRFMERQVPRPYHRHINRHRLAAWRERRKLTQKEVAERIGSKQPYISALETGKRTDALDEVYVRLAEVYGVPLSSFLLPPMLDQRFLLELWRERGLAWDKLLAELGLPNNIGIVRTMTLGEAKEFAATKGQGDGLPG
jgi:transcriptional regulator with XRE-family HTH domain